MNYLLKYTTSISPQVLYSVSAQIVFLRTNLTKFDHIFSKLFLEERYGRTHLSTNKTVACLDFQGCPEFSIEQLGPCRSSLVVC